MASNNKILVQIISADVSSWYKNRIGDVVEVTEFTEYFYKLDERHAIAKDNCRIIDEDEQMEGGSGGSRE